MRKKMAHMVHKCLFAMILSLLLAGCSLLTPTVQPTDTQVVPTGSPERVLSTDVFSVTCPEGWLTHEELFGSKGRLGHDPILDADEIFLINNAQSNIFGDKYTAACTVLVKSATEGKTLAEIAGASYGYLKENDYPILSQTEATFAGAPGIEVISKHPSGAAIYQFRDLWVEHSSKNYILSCQVSPGDYETTLPIFQQIAESFELK